MIRTLIIGTVILMPLSLLYFNINNPGIKGSWFLSIFALLVTYIKIRESFYTSKEKDSHKYSGDWTLIATSILYLFTGLVSIGEFFYKGNNINIYLTLIGLVITILAAVIRRISIKTLGDQWAIHAVGPSKLQAEHQLIEKGIYKYVRHPIYSSYILDLIGIALVFNSIHSLIFILLLNVPSYILRAKHEEKHSIGKIGNSYVEYKSRTSFLFPWIY